MNLLVSSEHRFARAPDGRIFAPTAGEYSFWTRYLDVFSTVSVLARVEEVPGAKETWVSVEGPGVNVVALPNYLGPTQFLRRAREVRSVALKAAQELEGALIMRVSSPIATVLIADCRRRARPFGLEVVGDPFDAFGRDAVSHPLRSVFRWWFTRELRHQCDAATAVAYVTATALQQRYPPRRSAFVTSYSSIELPPTAFALMPRSILSASWPAHLIAVGSLANWHKGVDTLLDAVALCVASGLDVDLTVVGDGRHRVELEQRADGLGLGRRVLFAGQLPPGEQIRTHFDQADLLVLPSRAEGLPRVLIEAMARGLPCIASSIGGIPELLDPEEMVPPGDVRALADKIRAVLTNVRRLEQMSSRNLIRARNYSEDVLRPRRTAFYAFMRDVSSEWTLERRA